MAVFFLTMPQFYNKKRKTVKIIVSKPYLIGKAPKRGL